MYDFLLIIYSFSFTIHFKVWSITYLKFHIRSTILTGCNWPKIYDLIAVSNLSKGLLANPRLSLFSFLQLSQNMKLGDFWSLESSGFQLTSWKSVPLRLLKNGNPYWKVKDYFFRIISTDYIQSQERLKRESIFTWQTLATVLQMLRRPLNFSGTQGRFLFQ